MVNDHRLPIDRGWAWIILLASSVQMFIILGQMKCYGIFFVLLQQKFQFTSSMTSLIFLVQEIAFSITVFVGSALLRSLSYRLACIIGSLLATSMYLMIGFANNINLVFVAAVGIGIAIGLIFPAPYAMVSIYFEKRRGLANSVCNGGLSLGGLALAPFYTLIMENYGFTGTYIMVAALHLNIIVTGMLLRPMEFYMRRQKKDDQRGPDPWAVKNVKPLESSIAIEELKLNSEIHASPGLNESSSPLNQKDQEQAETETCFTKHQDAYTAGVEMSDLKSKSKVGQFLYKSIAILRQPSFIYYLVANVFLCAGNAIVPAYVPPHAFEMGVTSERIAWLVSGPAVVDLVFRPIFGYISDTGLIRRPTMIFISSGLIGFCCQLFYLLTSFQTILSFSLLIGLCQGIYLSLFVVVLLEIIVMEELKGALGFTCLIQGVSTAIGLLIAGLIRDYTGSYVSTYHFIGSLLIVGAVMIFFLPVFHRRTAKQQEEKQ